MATAKQDRDASTQGPKGQGSQLATEVVAAVRDFELLDIKFWIEPSSATPDDILTVARDWIIGAERHIRGAQPTR